MDIPDLHQRASGEFGKRVRLIGDHQWKDPTPCPDWDVRGLVHHLVYENVWTPPMMEGATMEEVGDRFEGDILGDDPKAAFDAASAEAVAAVSAHDALERTVHLSFGDFPAAEYALQLFTDHLIHAWDLARALEVDERLDPELVAACAEWFAGQEELYRGAGVIGPRASVPDGADPQTRLLAAFGRSV